MASCPATELAKFHTCSHKGQISWGDTSFMRGFPVPLTSLRHTWLTATQAVKIACLAKTRSERPRTSLRVFPTGPGGSGCCWITNRKAFIPHAGSGVEVRWSSFILYHILFLNSQSFPLTFHSHQKNNNKERKKEAEKSKFSLPPKQIPLQEFNFSIKSRS